ncbi:hypothetical protein MXB_2880 [Myxobolus squamalis]|nr:hypothetical protein MXB_2880 [Myxobolus squamalis]
MKRINSPCLFVTNEDARCYPSLLKQSEVGFYPNNISATRNIFNLIEFCAMFPAVGMELFERILMCTLNGNLKLHTIFICF